MASQKISQLAVNSPLTGVEIVPLVQSGINVQTVIAEILDLAAVISVNGQTGVVVLDATDVGAIAPGDNIGLLTNDVGYITSVPDGDKGDITVSSTGATWTIDTNISKAWTGTHSFRDNSFSLLDNSDITKVAVFELSGITTATTRTFTLPDSNGVLALTSGVWTTTGTTTITTPTIVGNPFFEGSTIIGPTGAAITANTRLDIWGQGTGTALALRVANFGNSVRFTVADNGVFSFVSAARSNSFSTTWTATADNHASILFNGTITAANTTAHTLSFLQSGHTIISGNTNQNLISFNNAVSFTASHTGAVLIGFNYNPTIGGAQSASATNIAFRAVSGGVLLGSTAITANTRLDIRGISTGSALRVATDANALLLEVTNAGVITMNLGSDAIGDLYQRDASNNLSRLAAVTTGNVLLSGGVATASSWGKVGLTTHVSGILPIANGGTGSSTANFWPLTGTGILAGDVTIDANTRNFYFTSTAATDFIFQSGFGTSGQYGFGADTGGTIFLSTDEDGGTGKSCDFAIWANGDVSFEIQGGTGDFITNLVGTGFRNVTWGGASTGVFTITGFQNVVLAESLHLRTGTAAAGTAPAKLFTGTALTTPEDGALEYHTSHLYFTIGSTRYQLDQQGAALTSSNGITKVGNDFRLGVNPISANTLINDNGGGWNLEFGQSGSRFLNLRGYASNINFDGSVTTNIQTGTQSLALSTTVAALNGATTNISGTSALNLSSSGGNITSTTKHFFTTTATLAGHNWGSVTADPSTPADGDGWYRSDLDEYRGRANGVTITFGIITGLTANRVAYATSATTIGGSAGFTFDSVTGILSVKTIQVSISPDPVAVSNGDFFYSTSSHSYTGQKNGTPVSFVTSQTLTAGRVAFADGSANITGDSVFTFDSTSKALGIGTSSPDRRLHVEIDDAANSATTYLFRITHTTSGTPSIGIGVGMEFEVETSTANNEIGASVEAIVADTTSTSEDFNLVFKTMSAGAAASEKLSLGVNTLFTTNDFTVTGTGNVSLSANLAVSVFELSDGPAGVLTLNSDATTGGITVLQLLSKTSNTATTGFGCGLSFLAENGSGTVVLQGVIRTEFTDATDASEDSDMIFSTTVAGGGSTTEHLRFGTNKFSFFGATTVVKQTSGANLTNNVTSGGTDDTITNWTDLTLYSNDSAAIRNAIYQLSRKLKQINDGLRSYGLFT